MNNIIKILLIFIFINGCSLHKNSKFWTNEKIKEEMSATISEMFVQEKPSSLEFNPNLKISLYTKPINKSFFKNFDNNNGRTNYSGELENISKFKFSKIDNFNDYDPRLSFENDNIIFFDNKGSILKFNNNSKLVWKKNYYTKTEKNQKPILFFANNGQTLIVTDNIAKYYAINIDNGKLLWSKNNTAPFNSQIKIYKDKFFAIDFQNILRAYSMKNGEEIWNIKTENSLVRTQKKLSMVIVNNKIYFNNSLGDISSVDINSGELLWQIPTQNTLVYDESFFLKTSDIIANDNSLYLSNNKNQFFSIDIKTGTFNWMQKINSNLRSTIVDSYIFNISLEGYLFIIAKNTGNIIRTTDIFKNFKSKKRKNIQPTGFILGINDIYVTTNNGRLLVIEIATGAIKSIIKIDNDKISRPSVLNENLYIVKNNSVIKLN